jgi:hypothetical protein
MTAGKRLPRATRSVARRRTGAPGIHPARCLTNPRPHQLRQQENECR